MRRTYFSLGLPKRKREKTGLGLGTKKTNLGWYLLYANHYARCLLTYTTYNFSTSWQIRFTLICGMRLWKIMKLAQNHRIKFNQWVHDSNIVLFDSRTHIFILYHILAIQLIPTITSQKEYFIISFTWQENLDLRTKTLTQNYWKSHS